VEIVAENLVRAVEDPSDDKARGQMIMAAAFAGMGFGNAGVHLPHGMSYPVSGMVRSYVPEGYPTDHPIIPHGMSVILTAPAVFRFTAQANPSRHMRAAGLMGANVSEATPNEAGDLLADSLLDLMRKTHMPTGLGQVGYQPWLPVRYHSIASPSFRLALLQPKTSASYSWKACDGCFRHEEGER
jgi:hydroxyacid-oxoacid transhydrogenase